MKVAPIGIGGRVGSRLATELLARGHSVTGIARNVDNVRTAIGALPTAQRRLVTTGLTLTAAVAVVLVAEAFADALIETGVELGIDEFLLVQWLAPLASEAPEFVVVAIFAWRGTTGAAMGTLVSSKIKEVPTGRFRGISA